MRARFKSEKIVNLRRMQKFGWLQDVVFFFGAMAERLGFEAFVPMAAACNLTPNEMEKRLAERESQRHGCTFFMILCKSAW